MKITKEMKIEEILGKYPETREIFMKYGFHCIGCASANYESIAEGAVVHGIDIDKLIEELNITIGATKIQKSTNVQK